MYHVCPVLCCLVAATPGKDFSFAVGSKLHFEDVGTNRSYSSDQVVVRIINDEIAEPKELFICALKGDTVNAVQTKSPSQVTIEIFDNDGELNNASLQLYGCTCTSVLLSPNGI